MTLLTKKTRYCNRKFYNKWSYKVTIEVLGAAIFRCFSNNEILEAFSNLKSFRRKSYFIERALEDQEHIKQLIEFLNKNNLVDITKRIERESIDFYTNDKKVYDELSRTFTLRLRHRIELREGANQELENIISVARYPHGKYQYKVFLRPHKFNNDMSAKKHFLEWIENQGDRIKISSAVKQWFLTNNYNWDPRYIYVENEATLLMLSMRNTEAIGKVYRHHIIDK